MDWLTENWKLVADVVAYTIAAASIVVKMTPTPKDDTILEKVVAVLSVIGLNKKAP